MIISYDKWKSELISKRVVTHVTKKGRGQKFSALCIASSGNGTIGMGLSKSIDLGEAKRKAEAKAKRTAKSLPLTNFYTIPHTLVEKHCGTKIILKPGKGIGIRAGHIGKKIFDLIGFENLSCKVINSKNPINVAKTIMKGLFNLESVKRIARRRNTSIKNVLLKRKMMLDGTSFDEEKNLELMQKKQNQIRTPKPVEKKTYRDNRDNKTERPKTFNFKKPFVKKDSKKVFRKQTNYSKDLSN